MINHELATFLLTLYVMYGCFIAGKVSIGIRMDRASKELPVNKGALALVIFITMFLWAPIMLLGGKSDNKQGG